MRIIGGEFRSRRLIAPKDDSVTRPIPDRVKESLFGMLRGHCEGATVFDAFAGTGALGLEALSRGAERCVFVERTGEIADILRRNIEALGVADRCELVVGDALGPGALARAPRPLTLAFFDPPYPVVRDALGWKRVRTQFERVIDLLQPDGFAMLRTPHPLLVSGTPEAPPAPEGHAGLGDRPRRPRRMRDRSRRHEWTEEADAGDTHAADGDGGAAPEAESIVVTPSSPADLTFPNADGPETHVYRATAVNLYAPRRKPAAPV